MLSSPAGRNYSSCSIWENKSLHTLETTSQTNAIHLQHGRRVVKMSQQQNVCIHGLLHQDLCPVLPATSTEKHVVVNGGYKTGSDAASLWVQASVAESSSLPWKIGHLGASWRTNPSCCATTGWMPPPARKHQTRAGQMVPLPSYKQALWTVHCPLPVSPVLLFSKRMNLESWRPEVKKLSEMLRKLIFI